MIRKTLFALSSLFLLSPLFAEDEIIFVFEKYAPFEYYHNGKAEGVSVKIVENVCAKIGKIPKFSERSWIMAVDECKRGKADGIFSILKTRERENYFYYPSKPLYYARTVIVSLRESRKKIRSLSDLRGLRVAVVKGNFYGSKFAECIQCTKDICVDSDEVIRKLMWKRVDAAVFNEQIFEYYGTKAGAMRKLKIDIVVESLPYYVAFTKANGEKGYALFRLFEEKFR